VVSLSMGVIQPAASGHSAGFAACILLVSGGVATTEGLAVWSGVRWKRAMTGLERSRRTSVGDQECLRWTS
jgi:hypothetical protein